MNEDEERRKRRREKNKVAAARCRNKKKERTDFLQKVSRLLCMACNLEHVSLPAVVSQQQRVCLMSVGGVGQQISSCFSQFRIISVQDLKDIKGSSGH